MKVEKDFDCRKMLLNGEISIAIIKALEAKGMTKRDLALRAGFKPSFVTRILGCEHNFTITTLQKVADALEMDFKPAFVNRKQREEV